MDVGDLNSQQKQALIEFKKELGSDIPGHHDDRFLLKWLKARKFHVNKSKNMYLKSMEWRRRIDIDNILAWKAPEVLCKYYAGGQIGQDKEGCPVFIDLVSHMDFRGLLHSAKVSDIVKYETLQLEKCLDNMKKYTKQLGRPIDQFTVIMDLQKLGLKIFRTQFIKLYNETIIMTEDNYPEYLKRCFIINAPRIFPMMFNLVKPFLTEDTRSKIHILGSNWKEKVLQYIEADQLPVHWGGTRVDADGNVYCQINLGGEVPRSYYLKERAKDEDRTSKVTMKTVTIPRQQYHQVDVTVPTLGCSIRYQFSTETHDIGFGVYVTNQNSRGNLNDMAEVVPVAKVNSHLVMQDGAIPCDKSGTYVLVFDNRDSWVNAKSLSYDVELLSPDEGTDVDGVIDIKL